MALSANTYSQAGNGAFAVIAMLLRSQRSAINSISTLVRVNSTAAVRGLCSGIPSIRQEKSTQQAFRFKAP